MSEKVDKSLKALTAKLFRAVLDQFQTTLN